MMLSRILRAALPEPAQTVARFLRPPGHPGSRLTLKRLLNLYQLRWEYARGRTVLRSRPIKLTVEAANVCNLRCPACLTGVGEAGRVRSMMSLELYRALLAELGDYLFECEFCNWGEPLLSKFIYTMIADAHARGLRTVISTNFSVPFDAERAERLVASGLTVLGVSLDGARQNTYEQYRVRGNLETVLANCRLVREAKKKLGSKTPTVIWEFHVFQHNVGDIELARALARELEMEIWIGKGWTVGPEWHDDGRFSFFADPSPGRCQYLWQQAVVDNDGGVAPCCGAFYREDDLGKIAIRPEELGAASFAEVWNGPSFREARRLYQTRTGPVATRQMICFDCPQTIIWENWKKHLASGGSPKSFQAGYSTNEVFNFFFNRRRTRTSPARAHPVEESHAGPTESGRLAPVR